ncbi:MAG TPA: hypothetical protein VMT59_08640 [Gaiellaceae bacterium]|nr:hypothetical protein [Gaiellaceae bacterium]
MRRFIADMNPTLRGFILIALVAAVIVALSLGPALGTLFFIVQIVLLVVLVVFLYRLWRSHRSEIGMWPRRAQVVFYGSALVVIVDLAGYAFFAHGGLDAIAFLAVLVLCGFAMVRVWRDQRSVY